MANYKYKLIKRILRLFYDEKYLTGRWFEINKDGYKWAIRGLYEQKLLRNNRNVPWPCSSKIVVGNPDNIKFHVDDLNNFQHFGCYFQSYAGNIVLGKGTYIAPNVGLITQNHDVYNLDSHVDAKDIIIGERCWIGMNSVVLPGVVLGDNTIVGAGSIVTKSFEEGNCIIVGNPARKIKEI